MAVIKQNIPAEIKSIHATQWLVSLVEGVAQEQDAGRLVYIGVATDKRMTRNETGQFVGLDGSIVTEEDLSRGFLTPTTPFYRLDATVAYKDVKGSVSCPDLKDILSTPNFTKLKVALQDLSRQATKKLLANMPDGVVDETEDSPLDRM